MGIRQQAPTTCEGQVPGSTQEVPSGRRLINGTSLTFHLRCNMGLFSYWENEDRTQGHFQEDIGQKPTDVDGNEMTLIYSLVATTHEEALAAHYIRLGFSPYYPMGSPIKCPKCTHGHYYLGSGECYCGYKA
jgi:hypothetical protein